MGYFTRIPRISSTEFVWNQMLGRDEPHQDIVVVAAGIHARNMFSGNGYGMCAEIE